MYTCTVYFNQENDYEIRKLLNCSLIHSVLLRENFYEINTRKLWKLYWLNNRFKQFEHKFYYSKVFKASVEFPKSFYDMYHVSTECDGWYYKKITACFSNINEVWKIHLAFFLKK